MSRDDDRPSWTDREKKSFSELDRMRREGGGGGGERRPQGKHAQARADAASKQYRKEIDSLFSKGKGGAEGARLAQAMRDAHGTPGLADACRAFRDVVGIPVDPADLGIFLDSGDSELVVAALEALLAQQEAGSLTLSSGLASQVRMLSQDADDAIAEAAEDLLGAL
jgi:hypothetical protein